MFSSPWTSELLVLGLWTSYQLCRGPVPDWFLGCWPHIGTYTIGSLGSQFFTLLDFLVLLSVEVPHSVSLYNHVSPFSQ
jgi:hypothetical protein